MVLRKANPALLGAVLCGLVVAPAYATVTFKTSGTSSVGTPVSFEADLTISGNTLSVVLSNTSPVSLLAPNDALSSFYFDILGIGNTRPALTYASAFGDVYLGSRQNPDTLQAANANLKAVQAGDCKWEFKTMKATQTPLLGFGIGTVGNNNFTPNNFDGNIVGGFDYSIIKGDVTTQNLDGTLWVRDTATFSFTGVSGFTEANIANRVGFGLGTAPDKLMVSVVPEPGTALLLAVGGLALWLRKPAWPGGVLRS